MGFIRKPPGTPTKPTEYTAPGPGQPWYTGLDTSRILTTKTPKRPRFRGLFSGALGSLLLILIVAAAFTGISLAVTYYHDEVMISQTVTEGAFGEIKSLALPQGFNDTQQQYTVLRWINVTTEIDTVQLILSQESSQVTYLNSRYSVFTVNLYYASDDTLAFSWDMLTDLSAVETLATPNSYTFYAIMDYRPIALGTNEIWIDLDLVRTV